MRKILFGLGLCLSIVSCTSDYECFCTVDGQDVGYRKFEDVSRSKAVSQCKAFANTVRLTNPGAVCITPY